MTFMGPDIAASGGVWVTLLNKAEETTLTGSNLHFPELFSD